MKNSFLILFLFFFSVSIYAQSQSEVLVLSAVVKDKVIPNAQVIFQKNGETSVPKYTDASGKVTIPAEYMDDPSLTIIIKKEI